jgi:hypothetical protein
MKLVGGNMQDEPQQMMVVVLSAISRPTARKIADRLLSVGALVVALI